MDHTLQLLVLPPKPPSQLIAFAVSKVFFGGGGGGNSWNIPFTSYLRFQNTEIKHFVENSTSDRGSPNIDLDFKFEFFYQDSSRLSHTAEPDSATELKRTNFFLAKSEI
jgi:hypothetical protein